MHRSLVAGAALAALACSALTVPATATPASGNSPLASAIAEELTEYLAATTDGWQIDVNHADQRMETVMGLVAGGRQAQAQEIVDTALVYDRDALIWNDHRLAAGVHAVGRDPANFGGANLLLGDWYPGSLDGAEVRLRTTGTLGTADLAAVRSSVDPISGAYGRSPHHAVDAARAAAVLASTGNDEDVSLALAARDWTLGQQRPDSSFPGWLANTSQTSAYLQEVGVDISDELSLLLSLRNPDGGLANPSSLPPKPGMGYLSDAWHTSFALMAVTGTSPLTVGPSLARVADLSAHPVAVRLYGPTRFETAAAVAARFPVGAPAFVATGDNFPDALSGAALAGGRAGALLLTRRDSIPTATVAALERLRPASITVLGGTGSVDDAVLEGLRTYTTGPVTRLGSKDRYATSAAVARQYEPRTTSTVYVATGQSFPDGLAGGAAAGAAGQPLLITRREAVPEAVLSEVRRLDPQRIVVLGADGAVGSKALGQLRQIAPVTVRAGGDRYATAAAVAGDFRTVPTAVVATGANWPDALTATALAATLKAPLLLSRPTSLPGSTSAALESLGADQTFAVGGGGSLAPVVLDSLRGVPAP